MKGTLRRSRTRPGLRLVAAVARVLGVARGGAGDAECVASATAVQSLVAAVDLDGDGPVGTVTVDGEATAGDAGTTEGEAGTTEGEAGTTEGEAGTTEGEAGTTDAKAGTTEPCGAEAAGDADSTG